MVDVRCSVFLVSPSLAMKVSVHFYSYFKELTGCPGTIESISDGTTIAGLFQQLAEKYPKLAAMRKSTLIAVGLDYQTWDYVLRLGDEVSLFPPVQGG